MGDRHVLLLEDHPLLARAWLRELGALGWSLQHAATVRAARTLANQRDFLAWILDVELPDGSGIEFLAWARGQGKRVPVLVVTAGADPKTINDIVLWGGEFAFKPCTTAHVQRFLERAMEGHRWSVPDLAREYARANGLSTRETDLVVARASGVPHGDLSHALGVKLNTIKSMVRHIKKKTGVASMDALLHGLLRSHSRPPRSLRREGEGDLRHDGGAPRSDRPAGLED